MLTIFDNFDHFQQSWQFLTIFDNLNNFWQFWPFWNLFTIFTIWIFLQSWQLTTIDDNFHNSDNCFCHFDNWKDNPGDLWHLRHWLQFWQLRTWMWDFFLKETSINSFPKNRICLNICWNGRFFCFIKVNLLEIIRFVWLWSCRQVLQEEHCTQAK